MSYILDALRKSESERQQGKVPDFGQQVQMIHQPRRKSIPAGVWVALILTFNTVVLAYVFWPGRGVAPVQPADTVVMNTPAPEPVPAPVSYEVATPPAEVGQHQTVRVQIGDAVAEIQVPPAVLLQEPVQDEPVSLAEASSNQPDSGERPTVIVPSANRYQPLADANYRDEPYVGSERVRHLVELPMSFQKGIPDLIFNSHVYASDPAARRVMINDNYLRIGDSFSGIRVDRITEEGVILSKNGTRFRVGVVRDWISPR
ncbi:general secretion pathway protein GspB [Marinobacter mobilis]|uniref:general secretion pathway protein GspB n=1 Tax=Marinobacter mobilis TaxID=488533 RepID=UPI0035C68134